MDPNPILLQVQVELPQHNSTAIIAVLVGLLIAGAFFLINSLRGSAGRSHGQSHKFTKGRFRRTAYAHGLNQVQAKTLENLVLKYRPSDPMSVFTSTRALDILLAKAIAEIKQQTQSDGVKDAHINTIYRIKQAVEQKSGGSQTVRSSRQLAVGQEISITPENRIKYSSRVVEKLRNVLAVEIPLDEVGNQVRWKKWTSVEIFFTRGGGKGFAFQTKVLGYNVVRGTESILLRHSNSVSAATQRKYRRKQLDRPAYFYAIQIMTIGSGRKAKKQAVPQTKGALGTMLDVSAGGCAVKSTFPLPKGSLIKLEFETERRRQVAVYGKVKAVRKAEPMGGVMHVMFTRVSSKNLNRINSFVYEIG